MKPDLAMQIAECAYRTDSRQVNMNERRKVLHISLAMWMQLRYEAEPYMFARDLHSFYGMDVWVDSSLGEEGWEILVVEPGVVYEALPGSH